MKYTIQEITDKTLWETFVCTNSPVALFQSWAWGEVQKNTGARMWRYGVWEDSVLAGVFCVVLVRAKRGQFLHVRHGPIVSDMNLKIWKHVCDFLATKAKKYHCLFVRISPLLADIPENTHIFTSLQMVPAAMHRMDGEYCWVLDLAANEDELLAHMRKTTRYEIRRSQKESVVVKAYHDPSHIDAFLTLYEKTSIRQGFVAHTGLRQECEAFMKQGDGVLYIGSANGEILAGALVLYYGNQAIYHHGASIPSHAPVSYAIQWQAIRDAKKRGMNVYNFWGIAPEDNPKHPWRGITLFKKGFGGRELKYLHAYDLPISPLYVLPRSIEMIRKYLKGYD
jgi:peptidoglycan pentaglycine glycine transferase (the first glycine)